MYITQYIFSYYNATTLQRDSRHSGHTHAMNSWSLMLKKLVFLHHHPTITDSLSAGRLMVFLLEGTSIPNGPKIRDKGAGWNYNKDHSEWGTDAGVNPRVPWAGRAQPSCIWATLLI